jgi:hypothetical protein
VLDLDLYLQLDSDTIAFLEIIAESITHLHNIGYPNGIPASFYGSFEMARFAPPFADGADWRIVAWTFIKIAAVPLANIDRINALPLLRAIGC